MKRILFLAAIILVAFNTSVKAQDKIKEGKIKFEMTYPDSMASEFASFMPKETMVYFKNGNTRTEMKMGGGSMTMMVFKTGDHYTLMDMMGQKKAIKTTKAESNKLKDSLHVEKPVITMTDETKTIAFYKCRKALITVMIQGEKQTFEVWVTKDIDNIDMGDYSVAGVDGFAMESTIKEKGITIHMLCTSIEQFAVPDSLFKIPADYPVTTIDEMMKGAKGGQH